MSKIDKPSKDQCGNITCKRIVDELRDVLENMEHNPDLVAISDTKLKNHHDLNLIN